MLISAPVWIDCRVEHKGVENTENKKRLEIISLKAFNAMKYLYNNNLAFVWITEDFQ